MKILHLFVNTFYLWVYLVKQMWNSNCCKTEKFHLFYVKKSLFSCFGFAREESKILWWSMLKSSTKGQSYLYPFLVNLTSYSRCSCFLIRFFDWLNVSKRVFCVLVWGGSFYCFGILCIPLVYLGWSPGSSIGVFYIFCLPIKKKKKKKPSKKILKAESKDWKQKCLGMTGSKDVF